MLSLDERVCFRGRKGSSGGRNRHPRGWPSTFWCENGRPRGWTGTFKRENGHPRPWTSTFRRESGHRRPSRSTFKHESGHPRATRSTFTSENGCRRATKVKNKKKPARTSTSALSRLNIYGNFPQHLRLRGC